MFQITGPLPLSHTNATERAELTFRPLQRVTAEVIQVTATQAILSVDGKPIVAQLTSSDQAAALREQRIARFVVSQAQENNIVFKLIPPDTSPAGETAIKTQDLATRFLSENHVPSTAANLTLMQAMLNQRLPLNMDIFHELSSVLQQMGASDAQTANLAAALKAAGLPVTPNSLALVSQLNSNQAEQLSNLMQLLQQTSGKENLPESLKSLMSTVTQLLQEATPNLAGPRQEMAQALEKQIHLLGQSFENILQNQVETKEPFWPKDSLVLLSRLQTLAKDAGETDLSNTLSRLLEQTHQNQFLNIPTQSTNKSENWVQIPLFLQQPSTTTAPNELEDQKAQLRIVRRSNLPGAKIDPLNTHLSIEMELENGESIQVDLSLLGKQAQADIIVSHEDLLDAAQQEIPAFENGMEELGFLLSLSNLNIGKPEHEPALDIHLNDGHSLITVNLEI